MMRTLLTLITSGSNFGSLARINPTTGEETIIGPTGLSFNAFDLGEVRGRLYLTDLGNNIHSVDPETGVATPIGATGMPPDPTYLSPLTMMANSISATKVSMPLAESYMRRSTLSTWIQLRLHPR